MVSSRATRLGPSRWMGSEAQTGAAKSPCSGVGPDLQAGHHEHRSGHAPLLPIPPGPGSSDLRCGYTWNPKMCCSCECPTCLFRGSEAGMRRDRLEPQAGRSMWRENKTGTPMQIWDVKVKGTWLGRSGLSPYPGMTTAVTEGGRGTWHRVGPQGWRQCGTGRRALDSEPGP